jgi:hypothetical protein
MPFLQGSGAISIGNLDSFFTAGGTSMSSFYRGSSRVPATKTVTTITRDPTSGFPWNDQEFWIWRVSGDEVILVWGGTVIAVLSTPAATSYTVGNITYFRGTLRYINEYGAYTYHIYREISSSSTTNINTGIPSSGQISLSQFYGAERP